MILLTDCINIGTHFVTSGFKPASLNLKPASCTLIMNHDFSYLSEDELAAVCQPIVLYDFSYLTEDELAAVCQHLVLYDFSYLSEDELAAVCQHIVLYDFSYLTEDELAAVCQHIGMEDMNDEEIRHLFDKLDVDNDGRVGFNKIC